MTFAEKLIELRKSKGWSQEELGEKLDVTRQTVSKWELGSTTPEMEKIAMMSELFGITTDELIKGKTPEKVAIFTEDKIPAGSEVYFIEKRRKFGFEYKSEKTWHGMPLVHINLKGTAKGVLAIGLAAKGIFAIGLAALGVLSIGLVSIGVLALASFAALGVISGAGLSAGLLSCGGMSFGLFSMGGMSVGWFSFGGFSAGKYAIGGAAVGDIAVGGSASGTIAIGDSVDGEIAMKIPVTAEEVRAAIMSRLPNTPKFIADILSKFAESMTVE